MKNLSAPIFAIDFEGSKRIGVVEYGVAEIFGAKIARLYTRICAPKASITRKDADFFGISNSEAKKNPPFEADINLFCALRKRGIFASHNCQVEDSLLRAEAPSPGLVPKIPGNGGAMSKDWRPWIDTCALAKNIYPGITSAKLSDLIKIFGLQKDLDALAAKLCPEGRQKWHCAPYDALAAASILIKICTQEGFENVSFEWLVKYSSGASDSQKLLF